MSSIEPNISYLVNNPQLEVVKQPGLIAGWNMFPAHGKIIDVSDNGNDGIAGGFPSQRWTPLGTACEFDGVDDYFNCGNDSSLNVTTGMTFSCWFKADDLSHAGGGNASRIIDKGASIQIYILNTGDLFFVTTGVSDTSNTLSGFTTGRYYHIVCTYDSIAGIRRIYRNGLLSSEETSLTGNISTNSIDLFIGGNSLVNRQWKGLILSPQLYSFAQDETWVAQEYAKGRTALFKTDWGADESIASVSSGCLENTPFQVDSGSFKISNDKIDGETVKVIECVTNGICYVPVSYFQQTPTDAAFGEWTFWVNKDDASSLAILFISSYPGSLIDSSQNAYQFDFNVTESAFIRRRDSGVGTNLRSTSSAIVPGEWSLLNIVRSISGEISAFVNGAQISTSVTDTTYIASSYIVFSIGAGDKIAYSDIEGNHSIVKRLLT